MEIKEKFKSELGKGVKFNEPLREYVSFKVGGPADYFYVAETQEQLVKAIATAYNLDIPYFILGGGYNLVPSDEGFRVLVILNKTSNIAFDDTTSQVIADAGMNLSRLITLSASRDLGGLEFIFGIPGTVGGAVYGNAGAFGHDISEHVKTIIILMQIDGEMKIVKKEPSWMKFAYRSSILKTDFKEEKFKPVILTVKFQFARRRRDEILSLIQQYVNQKKDNQPLAEKSAGSFFKNPGIGKERAAGYLLEKAGAKKLRVGGACVSKRHANFLINHKNASAKDIKELAEKLKLLVKEKDNIDLEEEIEFFGQWHQQDINEIISN